MNAHELRKKLAIPFPKGLAESNYDYETYLSNQITDLENKIIHYENELTNLINDDRVPMIVGYWISEIMDGKKHRLKDES